MKKDKVEITETSRRTLWCELKHFDPGFSKEYDFIEVVEWTNGEGFEVTIESRNSEKFSLTWGQYEALKTLIKKLNKL